MLLKKFFLRENTLTVIGFLLLVSIGIHHSFEIFAPHVLVLPHIYQTIFAIIAMFVVIGIPFLFVSIKDKTALGEVKLLRGSILVCVLMILGKELFLPTTVENRSNVLYMCILLLFGAWWAKHFLQGFITFKNGQAEDQQG